LDAAEVVSTVICGAHADGEIASAGQAPGEPLGT
jgi:hypothetical protein